MNPLRYPRNVGESPILRMVRIIFYPITRMFLRHGVNFHEMRAVLAWCAVQAALTEPEFAIPGRDKHAQTLSHAAILTGMTRREVTNIAAMKRPDVDQISERTQRAMRLLAAWKNEPGFQEPDGTPRKLRMRGPAPSFEVLAKHIGGDIPARALADILVAEGNAEWVGRELKMLSSIKRANIADDDGIRVLSFITNDFLHSLQYSMSKPTRLLPRFREAFFEDISADRAEELRELMHRRIEEMNAEFSGMLQAFRAKPGERKMRVGAGLYSFFDPQRMM